MESSSEGVAIKVYFKAGKTATETAEMFRAACGVEALTRSDIFRWYGRFHEGRENVQDDHRSLYDWLTVHRSITLVDLQLMHRILIYLHIIHLLKSSTCFEHYPAHLQEVYVVIVHM
jgi:hypothetical protein